MSQVYVLHDEDGVLASGTVEDIAKTMGIKKYVCDGLHKISSLNPKKNNAN